MTRHLLEFLSLKEGCTGSSKSTLVKMTHRWKSHVTAHIWASKQENLSSEVCEQHRCRQACTSAQSAQRLCYSLFEK